MSALASSAAVLLVMLLAARLRGWLTGGRGRAPGRTRRSRSAPPTADEWAALLDGVSSELRTGSSLAVAVHHAVRRSDPHGEVITASSSLTSIAGACAAHPDEAVVLHAIAAARAVGGPMAATIDAASSLLRERAAVRGEAQAHSAQARFSARVLTGVPLAFAGWSTLSSRSFRSAIVSPVGLTSAALGCVANLAGWWWMRRIVSRVAT